MRPAARLFFLLVATGFSSTRLAAQFTDAPQTVARGEWLVETDLATGAYDRYTPARDGVRTRSVSLAVAQLTTGVMENVDVQIGIESWRDEDSSGAGVDECVRGTGGVYVRAKWKFWEAADGTALALLPYYQFRDTVSSRLRPTVSQFGVIVPFYRPLDEAWSFSAQAEVDWLDNGAGAREDWWAGYAVFARTLNKRWSWYWETTASAAGGRGRWATQSGLGIVWQMTEKFSWDAALYAGVNRAAPDWYPALRFVWAF
ncbi:MAG: transporter [Candidatus Didemnitutus sp.]|nr:transporter [Candidatus Didemnitutus sp.]